MVITYKTPYLPFGLVYRFFLFGSRDMWFEVPLPFFLRDAVQGLGWSRTITGLFLAVWIIVYGQVRRLPGHLDHRLRAGEASSWPSGSSFTGR